MATAKQGRFSYYELATFATAAPDTDTADTHLPALDNPTPKREVMRDTAQESDNDGMQSPDVATVLGGGLSFQTRIYSGTKKWDGGGTYPTSFACKPLIDNYFGVDGTSAFVGTTVASGGPGNSVPIVLTAGTNLTVGAALMFYPASGGSPEVRFVTSITTGTTITLDTDLTTAANYAAGAKVCAGFNYEPVLGAYAKYIAINKEGAAHNVLLSHGRITGLKLQGLAAKQGARWAFDLTADRWAAGFIPAGTYAYNAYGATSCFVTKGAPITIDETDTNCLELSVDFGCKHEEMPATSGTNGRAGWELTECTPSIEFTTYYHANMWVYFASRQSSSIRIVVPIGTTDTTMNIGTLAVYIPTAQVETEDVVVNGQVCTKVKATSVRMTAASKVAGIDKPVFMTIFGGI